MSRLVRLYPPAWRERYKAEFMELLETRPPTSADRIDILRGAFDAHLHPQVLHPRTVQAPAPSSVEDLRLARRLGFGTVVGAVLWVSAWVVASLGPIRYDVDGSYRDGAAAFPLLIAAVVLFAGGLAGQFLRLPATARLARTGAAVAIPFILLWGIAPWLFWLVVPALGGIVVLALGGRLSGTWPAWSAAAVALSCAALVGIVGYGLLNQVDRMTGATLFAMAAAAFVPAWLGIGGTLIRRPA